jgi:hypothetical protein
MNELFRQISTLFYKIGIGPSDSGLWEFTEIIYRPRPRPNGLRFSS